MERRHPRRHRSRSAAALFVLLAAAASSGAAPLPIPDASYEERETIRIVSFPTTECADATATPIVVGDYLLLPMHEKGRNCALQGKYGRSLLAYRLSDQTLYEIARGFGTEGTPLKAAGLLFWPVLTRGAFVILDAGSLETQVVATTVMSTCDSAGTSLTGLYYFGTINSPEAVCQMPVQRDCGALFAADAAGQIVHRLDAGGGFRAWITGGLTTDGTNLYAGTGTQVYGSSDDDYRYGCSVVKIDPGLHVLAAADPDDPGCHFAGRLESAVAGEPVLGPSSVWVQFIAPGDAREKVAVVRYDRDLDEICRAELDGSSQFTSASFYQAPTVDRDGNAYVTYTLPDPVTRGKYGALFRITPECAIRELARAATSAGASPTLADDRYALFATEGFLHIYGTDGTLQRSIALGSAAPVIAAPVLHQGTIYVFATDGTLTIIPDTGLGGYGSAYWPRFRHDNDGSGRADAAPPSPSPTPLEATCHGDCDGSGAVTVDELVLAVNIALGAETSARCTALDSNGDKVVTIQDLISAVGAALQGCP